MKVVVSVVGRKRAAHGYSGWRVTLKLFASMGKTAEDVEESMYWLKMFSGGCSED